MARLIINPTSASRREIHLPRTALSVGRDPANDLVLPDAMVSRRHAVIEFRENLFFLRDCNSSNGSLLNGERVTECRLKDGDLVSIGATRILFRDEADATIETSQPVGAAPAPAFRCPACHEEINEGDQFCRRCGASVAPTPAAKMLCPLCSSVVKLPARFCHACGTELPQDDDRMATTRPRPAHRHSEAGASSPPPPQEPPVSFPVETVDTKIPEPPPRERALPPPPPERPPRIQPDAQPVRHPSRAASLSPAARGSEATARSQEPAGAMRRLVAAVIDNFLVSLGALLLLSPAIYYWFSRDLTNLFSRDFDNLTYLPFLLTAILLVVTFLLSSLYYIYFWGVQGATPGKQIVGLVIQDRDGVVPIGVGRATLRLIGYTLSSFTLGIGFFLIVFTGYGLHDHIAGTRVVRQNLQ